MKALLLFAIVAIALGIFVYSRNRRVAVAVSAAVDSAGAALAPVIGGSVADLELMGQSAKGLRGRYHDLAISAGFVNHSLITGASVRYAYSFQLWADEMDGAELWELSYRHLMGGDQWGFIATSDACQARLEAAGLLDACAPLTGHGATVTYYAPLRRILAGWPDQPVQTWPDAPEFESRLAILERIVAAHRAGDS